MFLDRVGPVFHGIYMYLPSRYDCQDRRQSSQLRLRTRQVLNRTEIQT